MTMQASAEGSEQGRPILSIVTPVFNSGRLLREGLLHSMAAYAPSQAVQWVVVNDASTDTATLESLEAMRQMANVIVVDMDVNRGPGEARNRGIAQAVGTWTAFIDSDDRCDVEELLRACTSSFEQKADVLSLSYRWHSRTGKAHIATGDVQREDVRALIARRPAVWRFVFRTRFLRSGPRFPALRYGEDLLFLLQASRLNPTVVALPSLAAITYRAPNSPRSVSPKDRLRLLEALTTLRESSASSEERACIDSWALRVMAHGLRRSAAATICDRPYPRLQLIETARALAYTVSPYVRRVRRNSTSPASPEARLSGAQPW